MFITAVCVLFFIKLRWSKNKSLFVSSYNFISRLSMIVQVNVVDNVVLNRTVIVDSDGRLENPFGSHLQSQSSCMTSG